MQVIFFKNKKPRHPNNYLDGGVHFLLYTFYFILLILVHYHKFLHRDVVICLHAQGVDACGEVF